MKNMWRYKLSEITTGFPCCVVSFPCGAIIISDDYYVKDKGSTYCLFNVISKENKIEDVAEDLKKHKKAKFKRIICRGRFIHTITNNIEILSSSFTNKYTHDAPNFSVRLQICEFGTTIEEYYVDQ